jgi:hypothetical protein
VIATPLNDRECLGAITEQVAAMVESRDPALVAIADQYEDPEALADWIRTLPQRDDQGMPCDGPKVQACRPPQRLRIPADDPNCVERASLFLGAAELIDPRPVRRLATVDTPGGLHTFPTEDGAPVILDPMQSRNALREGLTETATRRLRLQRLIGTDETRGVRGDLARARASKAAGHTTWVDGKPIDVAIATYEKALVTYQALLDGLPRNSSRHTRNAGQVALTPNEAVDWIGELAAGPAASLPDGSRRARNGHRALRGVLVGQPLCVADARDVAFVLALADREARSYGPAGPRIVRTTAYAVDRLDEATARRWMDAQTATRNGASLQIGRYRVMPNLPLLASLGRVGGRLGMKVGIEALRVKLATLGVTPPVLNSIEQEMNREGLSLGALAAPPPMFGSLGSLTPEALAGRWLADKL